MAEQKLMFYTNARMGRKTALLAGPFYDAEEAGKCIDLLGPAFIEADPAAEGATFGVMSCKTHAGLGVYNIPLRANGINVEVPEN